MKLKLNISVIAVSLVPLTAFGQVSPPPDDTADLITEIMAISQAGTGTLQAKTYYVRDIASLSSSQWNSLYNANTGVVKPLRVVGATTQLGHPKTRIIAGIGIPSQNWHSWSELGSDDPWKSRFPVTVQPDLKWVDLDDNWTDTFENQLVTYHLETGYFFTNWLNAEKDNEVGGGSVNTPICATVGGYNLKFASAETQYTDYDFYRASTSPTGDPQKTFRLTDEGNASLPGWALNFAQQTDAATDLRATLFCRSDYRAISAKFSSVAWELVQGGGAGTDIGRFTGTLVSDPFPLEPGANINTWASSSAFDFGTLLNS